MPTLAGGIENYHAASKRKHFLAETIDQLVASIMIGFPVALFAFLFGLSALDQISIVSDVDIIGGIVVLDALKHSTFPVSFGLLDAVFISPHMHQLHHSEAKRHWNKNFGSKLSIWDRLLGTSMVPQTGEKITFGLGQAENRRYTNVFSAYW